MKTKVTLAGQEIKDYVHDCALLKVGEVRDGGSSFFVVTKIETVGKLVMVTGDIINDDEMLMDRRMGCGAVIGLWPDTYLTDVRQSHIWGAFYEKKLGERE